MAVNPEYVRIAILDTEDRPVGFLDNRGSKTLHYCDETLHRYLDGSAYTFSFTTFNGHNDADLLEVGNGLSFRYDGRDYYLKIMTVEKTEEEITVTACGGSFAFLNDYIGEMSFTGATFEQALAYIQGGTHIEAGNNPLSIGLNEIADDTRTGEFTNEETVLARLFALGDLFGAEIEIVNEIDQTHALVKTYLNIYKKHDKNNQGMGQDRRGEILRYGKDIAGLSKTSDITELATSIIVSGSGGKTLLGWENPAENGLDDVILDEDGEVLYEREGTIIRAPQARERFPSVGGMSTNGYITKPFTSNFATEEEIYRDALEEIRVCSEPKLTYSVDGYVDAEIGDTFTIEDTAYSPTLFVEARVVEQEICFTDPSRNKTTFDNFTEVSAEINPDLIKMMDKLKEESRPYFAIITAPNGTELASPESMTTLSVSVETEDGQDVTNRFTFIWTQDGRQRPETTPTLTINGWFDAVDSSVFQVSCYLDGVRKTGAEVIIWCKDGEKSVTAYYLITDQDKGIMRSDPRFTTQLVEPTAARPYLWTYTKHEYKKSGPKYTEPFLLRTYMPPVEPGRGIDLMIPQYYLSESQTELNSADGPPGDDTVKTERPKWTYGLYLWTRTKIFWSTGNPSTTDWVLDADWMANYEPYEKLKEQLDKAQTIINKTIEDLPDAIRNTVTKTWFDATYDGEGNLIELGLLDKVDALATASTDFRQTYDEFTAMVTSWQEAITKDIDDNVKAFIQVISKVVQLNEDGLHIKAFIGSGEEAVEADMRLTLDNDEIKFVHTASGATVMTITADAIHIEHGVFQTLDIVPFGFRKRSNGALCFKKIY